MKLLFQLFLVILFCFIGDIISKILPFTMPGSVIGLIIMFAFLLFGVVKEKEIDSVSDFLVGNMGIFFVPLTVGLMDSYKLFADDILPIIAVIFISVIIGLLATYGSTIFVKKFMGKKVK